jgi:hypothetical protein
MPEFAEQTTQQGPLEKQIHSVMSQLAPEHGINLKENQYQKYIDQLLAVEFRGREDVPLEEIAAALKFPLLIASISKEGLERSEKWYANAYCREKKLEAEYADFKLSLGKKPSLEEISLYLRFFQKKGVMEDYDRWFEEKWRSDCFDSSETSDFWMSGTFLMRHYIREKMGHLEMPIPDQGKKNPRLSKGKN